MTIYRVYCWEGEYSDYWESNEKYFLNKASAEKYYNELRSENDENLKSDLEVYGHDKFSTYGVNFEEIDVIVK